MDKRTWKNKIYNSVMFIAAICTIMGITVLGIINEIFEIKGNKSINESIATESLSNINFENNVTHNNNQNSIDVNAEIKKLN